MNIQDLHFLVMATNKEEKERVLEHLLSEFGENIVLNSMHIGSRTKLLEHIFEVCDRNNRIPVVLVQQDGRAVRPSKEFFRSAKKYSKGGIFVLYNSPEEKDRLNFVGEMLLREQEINKANGSSLEGRINMHNPFRSSIELADFQLDNPQWVMCCEDPYHMTREGMEYDVERYFENREGPYIPIS
jgi:hypothetical protein